MSDQTPRPDQPESSDAAQQSGQAEQTAPAQQTPPAQPAAAARTGPGQPPFARPAPGQPPFPAPFAPAPPPRSEGHFRRGFGVGAGVGVGLGVALLALSIVGSLLTGIILAGFASAAATYSGASQTAIQPLRTVWGPDSATEQLRAVPVRGAIQTRGSDGLALTAGTYGYEVAEVLDRLTPEAADGVVLMLDTPGGSVNGSKAISDAVDRYRERTGKKVFAFVEETSASGGMYAMAGADEVVADHGSLVGSVGVIFGPIERYRDVTGAGSLLTGQITAREITAEYLTAGRGKDVGNPFRDLTASERASLQAIVDSMYDDFVTHVSTKRGIDANVIVDELGAGMFVADRAKEVGYVDEVLDRDQAMRHFATAAGLDPASTRVVEAAAPSVWASVFGAESRAWGAAPAAQPTEGQPARATSGICTDTTPLLFHGDLSAVCG